MLWFLVAQAQYCNKLELTTKHITPRQSYVKYGASDTFTPEKNQLCEKFITVTKEEIFKNIHPITVGLKKSYMDDLNKKEVTSRTISLIKNHSTTSITASTAKALEKEDNVQLENLKLLIDDCAAIAVKKLKEKKKKKRKKNKAHTPITSELNSSSTTGEKNPLTPFKP